MQHFVARQPYGVEDSPLLQVLIDVRLGECGVGAKVPAHSESPRSGTGSDPIHHATCARYVRSPHAAWRPRSPRTVEHEQRVIARAPKVTVVRCSLLFSMYRALRTVHVQDHPPVRRAGHSSVHPLSVQSPNPSTLPSWVSTSVSNRLMVLVLAAGLSGPPRRPTITRIVGSWASRSASLVSS